VTHREIPISEASELLNGCRTEVKTT